jgi:hypothetical protein
MAEERGIAHSIHYAALNKQVKKCHGDAREHPCAETRKESK